jgi:membrane-bound metal-dependent hydrolase YbcI (DUF457 family)
MDPVSHVAFGTVLVRAFGRPPSRSMAPVASLGALSPDIDLLIVPLGWDRYLRAHEVGTHSIGGAIAGALLVTVLMRAVRGRASGGLPLVALAAIVGALSHLALDVGSGATIRLLWPVLETRYSFPLVSMADPWLAAILIAGAAWCWRLRGRTPGSAATWAARATLVVVVSFLGWKGTMLAEAVRAYERAMGGREPEAWMAEAEWGSLATWLVHDRTSHRVRQWRVDAATGVVWQRLDVPMNVHTRAARRSLSFESVRNLTRTHEFVFASTEDRGNSTRVVWSDVRYCDPDSRGRGTLACSLWFGGTLSETGTPVGEEIVAGGYVRERR